MKYFAALVISLCASVSNAQQIVCASGDSDTDGDGWGWENGVSCMVNVSNASDGICTDSAPVGDGWGWDGSVSCTIPAIVDTTLNDCVDTDGDGYGWDGSETCLVNQTDTNPIDPLQQADACIDTDGDGYGWNGFETCSPDTSVDNRNDEPAQIVQATSYPILSDSTDPLWNVCASDIGQDSSDAWQLEDVPAGRVQRVCVKRCPDGADFIPDPDFPGWGWDNENATACAQVPADANQFSYSGIPLYLPSAIPARQVFNSPLIAPLFHANPTWQCSHQQRMLSSDEFQDSGESLTYVFSADGIFEMSNSLGAQAQLGSWSLYTGGSRIIRLVPGPRNAALQSTTGYMGNLIFSEDNKTFTVYQTTVDRLVCESNLATNPTAAYPQSIEEINASPVLGVSELENRSLSCDWIQSKSYDEYVSSNTGEGYEPRCKTGNDCFDGSGEATTVLIQSLPYNDALAIPNRYTLGGDLSYHGSHELSSFNPSVGEVFTGGPGEIVYVDFREWDDRILMTRTETYYARQEGRHSVNYYMCQ